MSKWKRGPGSTYGQKLLDPRWQKRRLEILERDGWKCQEPDCGDKTATLHVHHRWYEPGADPWDAGDDALVTLCESCHEAERGRRGIEDALLDRLSRHLLAGELDQFACFLWVAPRDVLRALAGSGTDPEQFAAVERWMNERRARYEDIQREIAAKKEGGA